MKGAIKFKMRREPITIPDLVVGDVRRELTDREAADPDFVIVRSDGQPVFHFVNVIDDLEMGITHVIRGEDHLSNTAKHLALFQAFGVKPPHYAHIPLILNLDGSKMSKRDTGASLTHYMENGHAPEAVLNYLCLLGWSLPPNSCWLLPKVIFRLPLPKPIFRPPKGASAPPNRCWPQQQGLSALRNWPCPLRNERWSLPMRLFVRQNGPFRLTTRSKVPFLVARGHEPHSIPDNTRWIRVCTHRLPLF
jgi:glutamyl-tRNA synthetase